MTQAPDHCPCCHQDHVRFLAGASQEATVDYYRCDGCGHIWTLSRDGTARIRHVTPLKRDEETDS